VWIRDLPFQSGNGLGVVPGSVATSNFTFTGTAPTSYMGNSATAFRLFAQVSGGGGTNLLVSSIVSGTSWVYFVVTYQV
jgi:hypothetical protein